MCVPIDCRKINQLSVYVFSDIKIMRRVKRKRGIHSPCTNLACSLTCDTSEANKDKNNCCHIAWQTFQFAWKLGLEV